MYISQYSLIQKKIKMPTEYFKVLQTARKAFASGVTKPVKFRLQQLESLLKLCEENEEKLIEAVKRDLKKSKIEIRLTELEYLKNEIRGAIYNLTEWVKPQSTEKNLVLLMDDSFIHSEPFGVVLIIGPWNYPVQLSLVPLVGVISAGNCAVIKPSEISENAAEVLAELLPKYLHQDCYQVVKGGVPETTELLKEKFDYIFFTGSTTVGKIIYQAAAKNLTPVTLELGGKSPVYLDDSVNMDMACRRIIWGKLLSLGQTCVAPDYILCNEEVQDLFLKSSKKVLAEFFEGDPIDSPDIGRIINDRNYKRVQSYLKDGNIAIGGKTRDEDQYIAPTILTGVKNEHQVMKDEIFGPILPIYLVKDEDEAINYINENEKPLSLYVFSTKKNIINKFMQKTTSGSLCVNDTVIHLTIDALPFGGVGFSGLGSKYHGKASFDAFSNKKSVLIRNFNPILEKIASDRYPPFSEAKSSRLRFLLKKRKNYIPSCFPYLAVFVLGMMSIVILKIVFNAADWNDKLPKILQ
ncbi:aldehyde dehydrogenase, dimeric NADP-preferring-like isoform X3 [Centruroides vittatus]|uniref:aldehyde dehydrogenase, dimeric NADP-preferring-like isoform X3 n=1 Tax=Centruroides vittatus TaxID=120091 RepID=UPI00350E9430